MGLHTRLFVKLSTEMNMYTLLVAILGFNTRESLWVCV